MNKTISVHLGGLFFHVEEEAYANLKNYLDLVRSAISHESDATEIMHDIEIRIAEILLQSIQSRNAQVVIHADVEHVIEIMGKPEDYGSDRNAENTNEFHQENTQTHFRKRMYRDKDEGRLGGVCAGLSHYLGMDPVVVRVITVLLFFLSGGTVFLAYIIFWAIVPEARTSAEKLHMRGEPVNIENISRFFKTEAQQAAENMKKWEKKMKANSKYYQHKTKNYAYHYSNQAAQYGKEGLHQVSNFFTKLIGMFNLTVGLLILFFVFVLLFAADYELFDNAITFEQFRNFLFPESDHAQSLMVGLFFIIAIPALSAIYSGIRLITGYRKKMKWWSWIAGTFILVGAVLVTLSGLSIAHEFKSESHLKTNINLDTLNTQELIVDVKEDDIFLGRDYSHKDDFFDLLKLESHNMYMGSPVELNFEPTDMEHFSVRIERSCHGSRLAQAGELASNIEYHYSLSDNVLLLDPYLSIPEGQPYRGQQINIIVFVPKGKKVKMGNNVGLIYWRDVYGRTLTMGDTGWDEY